MQILAADVVANHFFLSEPDRVVLFGALAFQVLNGTIPDNPDPLQDAPGAVQFIEQFEVDFSYYPAFNRSDEIERMHLIMRRSDEKLFGFQHWDDLSEGIDFTSNGSANDIVVAEEREDEWLDPFVFLPIEPVTIRSFAYIK